MSDPFHCPTCNEWVMDHDHLAECRAAGPRGDDELDAAVLEALASDPSQPAATRSMARNNLDLGKLLQLAGSRIAELATALATAKGEVERLEEERDDAANMYAETRQRNGRLLSERADLTAALSTAKGERDAAVAALREIALALPEDMDFGSLTDIAANWRATLEAPHA